VPAARGERRFSANVASPLRHLQADGNLPTVEVGNRLSTQVGADENLLGERAAQVMRSAQEGRDMDASAEDQTYPYAIDRRRGWPR
jgi:hypothetical protein